MKRRLLAVVLVICLVLSIAPAFAAPAPDVVGLWSEEYITPLQDLGIMNGYPDGTFRPNENITTAELVTLLDRAFGLKEKKAIAYSDVAEGAWYYEYFQLATDYVLSSAGKVNPNKKLNRQEATSMFSRLMGFSANSTASNQFKDDASIDSGAKGYIYGSVSKKLINGYPDNTFRPKNNITRAEVAKVLCVLLGSCINKSGTYNTLPTEFDNVTIMSPGVTLNGVHIKGDLYLTGAVGSGIVTLNNCTIDGEIIAIGNPGAALTFKGITDKVKVRADGLSIVVEGTVNDMTVTSTTGKSATISGSADGKIVKLTMNTPGKVTCLVEKAVINVSGVTLSVMPDEWTLASGVTVTIAGTVYDKSGKKGPAFASGFPTVDVDPSVDGKTKDITVAVKMMESAELSCIAVLSGSPEPTAEQVYAMADYGTVKIEASNFADYDDLDSTMLIEIIGLDYNFAYDIYVVAKSSKGILGTPTKMTVYSPFYASSYPVLYGITESTATVAVKTVNTSTVYMLAVPAGSAAPTAQQLATGSIGAGFASITVAANTEEHITMEGLTAGSMAYDIYVGAGSMGALPTEIVKFDLKNANNTVSISYSQAAFEGTYPVDTTLTMRFSDKIYRADNEQQIGTLGAEPAQVITVTAVKTSDGQAVSVYGYTMTPVNNTIILAPPTGGWTYGCTYTVNLENVVDSKGLSIQPRRVEFTIEDNNTTVPEPVMTPGNGSDIVPGGSITLSLPTSVRKPAEALIRYTTDGSDPVYSATSQAVSGETGVNITVPVTAAMGTEFVIRALTKIGSTYSSEAKAVYHVSNSMLEPVVIDAATGAELVSGTEITNGTSLYLLSPKSTSRLYYTVDGTDPVISGTGVNYTSILATGGNGTMMTIKVILVDGTYMSDVYNFSYIFRDYVSSPRPSTPTIALKSDLSPISDDASVKVQASDAILIYSFNDYQNSTVYYTWDGTDPANNALTRKEIKAAAAGQTLTISAAELPLNVPKTLRLIVFNSNNGFYSGERTIKFTRVK